MKKDPEVLFSCLNFSTGPVEDSRLSACNPLIVESTFALTPVSMAAAITCVAGYLPEDKLTNADLEKMVDTSDEWIRTRTGIEERRIQKDPNNAPSDMGAEAVKSLCAKSGLAPTDIDLIICATVTPDMLFPSTANLIGHKVGATKAWGFDLSAACSGFLFALKTGAQFVENGSAKNVVVVGADKMSSIIDYTDRTTCVLFGDAAAAVLLQQDEGDCGIIDSQLYSDGAGETLHARWRFAPTCKSRHCGCEAALHLPRRTTRLQAAVTNMADVSYEVMERNNLTADDVAWLVPHQANLRIIDATQRRTGLPHEKVMINIHKYGNTTAATIPLCLYDWESQLKRGDNLILAAFGGGFTWGSVYVKWAYDGSK